MKATQDQILAAIVLVAWLLAAACVSTPLEGAEREVLVVGSDIGNAPFAWIEGELAAAELPAAWSDARAGEGVVVADGAPAPDLRALGRDVEMAEALAAELGAKLVWKRLPFDALLAAVEAGEVDVVIATLGWTAERAARVELSRPYFRTTIEAVVRTGPGEPRSAGDLAGKRVSAGLGTTSELAVRESVPGALLRAAGDKGQTGLPGLLAGDLDALVMDGPDARDLVAAHPDAVTLLRSPLAREEYVIAVDPDQQALLAAVNRFLERQAEAGQRQDLDARFGLKATD